MKSKTDIINITRPCDRCAFEVPIYRKHCMKCNYLINPVGLYHLLPLTDELGFDLEGYDCGEISDTEPF